MFALKHSLENNERKLISHTGLQSTAFRTSSTANAASSTTPCPAHLLRSLERGRPAPRPSTGVSAAWAHVPAGGAGTRALSRLGLRPRPLPAGRAGEMRAAPCARRDQPRLDRHLSHDRRPAGRCREHGRRSRIPREPPPPCPGAAPTGSRVSCLLSGGRNRLSLLSYDTRALTPDTRRH